MDAIVQLVETGVLAGDYVPTAENLITKRVDKLR
jgi:hypothetical protein